MGRGSSIANEWKYDTKAKLEAGDTKVTALIKDRSTYKVPGTAPTGTYRGPATCANGVNHS